MNNYRKLYSTACTWIFAILSKKKGTAIGSEESSNRGEFSIYVNIGI